MASKKSKELSTSQKVGIGVGLTAAAVAAAGSYFLYGSKDAAKNRKRVKSWTLKAKAEVLEVIENAEHMSEDEYKALIAEVSKTYGAMKDVSKTDVATFTKEMHQHWKEIEKQGKKVLGEAAKKAKTKAKKTTPKKASAKKTVPKKKVTAKKSAAKKAPAKKK